MLQLPFWFKFKPRFVVELVFNTCDISLRFTPMYPRRWARRLALKLEWNMYPTSLIAKDDQVAMKLAPCYFTSFLSTNFSILVNNVSVFFTYFSCFSFLLLFSNMLCYLFIQCILLHNPQIFFWGYNMALRIIN